MSPAPPLPCTSAPLHLRSLTLSLAGWRVRLAGAQGALAEALAARYGAFVASDPLPPHLDIAISPAVAAHEALATPDVAIRFSADGGVCALDGGGFLGAIAIAEGTGHLALRSSAPLADIEYFLRAAYALLAYHDGGLLLHAAGLLDADGRAILFTGPSGSGKSTVTTLSPGATALNDDLVLLRPAPAAAVGGGWIAHGTPFWNAETLERRGQTAHGALAGVYRLVQAPDVRLEPLSPAAAVAELVANCPVVNGSAELLPGLLARCREIARTVPVARLRFRKEPSFWGVIT